MENYNLEQINSKIRATEARLALVTCDDEYFTLTDDLDRLVQMADEYEKDGE